MTNQEHEYSSHWHFPIYVRIEALFFLCGLLTKLSLIVVGLYIEQICLAGLFFLATDAQGNRSSLPQGILMVILIGITVTTQILLHKSYDRA